MIPFIICFLLTIVNGKLLTGIFTSFDSFDYNPGSVNTVASPNSGWLATFPWQIDGGIVEPGDTFQLLIRCGSISDNAGAGINLAVLQTKVASCTTETIASVDGSAPLAKLLCTITSDIKKNAKYSGTLSLQIAFNIGKSSKPDDLICASEFSKGINSVVKQVTISDGKNEFTHYASFEGGPLRDYNPENIIFGRVKESSDSRFNFLLAGNCPNGYTVGTLGISSSEETLNCDTIYQGITSKLNAWYLPMNFQKSNFDFTCSKGSFEIRYKNIPKGYRPYISLSSIYTEFKDI